MGILDISKVQGDNFQLKRTSPLHFNGAGYNGMSVEPAEKRDFASLMMDKIDDVNALQGDVNHLNELMLTDPDSVDVHEVTIAMAKAQMAMGMTKAVVDKAVQAYKDIVNMR